MTRFVVPLLAAMLAAFAASAQDWGQVSTPPPGPTQSIGFYTAGCLQGAQALPLDGPGYEAIRISRNRYWGQPVTLDFIKTLAEKVRAAGQAPLYIGDIGQPRGGPAPSGHASHQTGLDADIWFERQPGAAAGAGANARTRDCARWCAADDSGIDDSVFTQQHVSAAAPGRRDAASSTASS